MTEKKMESRILPLFKKSGEIMAVKPPTRLEMLQSGDYVLFSRPALENLSRKIPSIDWSVSPGGGREAEPLELDFYQAVFRELRVLNRPDFRVIGAAQPNSLLRKDVVLISADLVSEGDLQMSEEGLAKCVFIARDFFITRGTESFSVRGPVAAFGRTHTTHREAISACIVNAGAGKERASDPASVLELEKR